jgi:zinc transport system ATP-binding protein
VICLNGHVCCQGTPDILASAPEYRALFGTGTQGALALYRYDHNHSHDDGCTHDRTQDHTHPQTADTGVIPLHQAAKTKVH